MKIINILAAVLLITSCNTKTQNPDMLEAEKLRGPTSYRYDAVTMIASSGDGNLENITLSNPVQILVIPEAMVQVRIPDETVLTAVYYKTEEDTCYLGLNNGRPFRLRVYEYFIIINEGGLQTVYPVNYQ